MQAQRKKVLVAPLDWGLGHATRCIPIIRALQAHGCEVQLAGNGSSLQLLHEEFPALQSFELAAYNPLYPTNGSMVIKMGAQLPKFIRAIHEEHRQVSELVSCEAIDVVIADNRYGCYSAKAKSIIITHQLNILMPKSFAWMEGMVNYFNHAQLCKFDEVWVPDFDGQKSLAGKLSAVPMSEVETRFIGVLSRFEKLEREKKFDVLAIASGPEPQRTSFESLLRRQIQASGKRTLLVCGHIADSKEWKRVNNFAEVNYMTSQELNEAICESEIIITRSGYSTVMDLAKLNAKAVFIPTPGQTEQEYLAEQLMQKRVAFCMPQREFDLQLALQVSKHYSGFSDVMFDQLLLTKATESLV